MGSVSEKLREPSKVGIVALRSRCPGPRSGPLGQGVDMAH